MVGIDEWRRCVNREAAAREGGGAAGAPDAASPFEKGYLCTCVSQACQWTFDQDAHAAVQQAAVAYMSGYDKACSAQHVIRVAVQRPDEETATVQAQCVPGFNRGVLCRVALS